MFFKKRKQEKEEQLELRRIESNKIVDDHRKNIRTLEKFVDQWEPGEKALYLDREVYFIYGCVVQDDYYWEGRQLISEIVRPIIDIEYWTDSNCLKKVTLKLTHIFLLKKIKGKKMPNG